VIRRLRVPIAATLLAAPLLLFLWGRIPFPRPPGTAEPPAALRRAFANAVAELGRRAADFQSQRDVARSLEGGGVAVNRLGLFTAAGHALAAAPPGSGLALTDPAGTVHAWWGDAPPISGLEFSPANVAVRWSATRFVVVERKPVGATGFSGLVWCQSSCDIGSGDQLGSAANPVLLVIDSSSEVQIKGKVFGAMPMTARLTPAEARKGLKLVNFKLALFLLTFLVR